MKKKANAGDGRGPHKLQARWPSALALAAGATFTVTKDVAFTPFVLKRNKENVHGYDTIRVGRF